MRAGQRVTAAAVTGLAALAIFAGPVSAQFLNYSASGTHTCSDGAGPRTCVVTGFSFSSCFDATSSLKIQDCCRSPKSCARDPKTGARRCEDGRKSVSFHLNYCLGGGY